MVREPPSSNGHSLTSEEKVARLREWIITQNSHAAGMDLDTDIIDLRLVDSLQFATFLLLIEELRGAEIAQEDIDPERFRTLRSIAANFLSA